MIEQLQPPMGVSLLEAVLARWLVGMSGVQYILDSVPLPHPAGCPQVDRPVRPPVEDPASASESQSWSESGSESESVEDSAADEAQFPGLAAWRGLLEAGAARLAAARVAEVEQRRQAAVQLRELAAFAALRPAAVLDRPDEAVGAAAAASRAARPAALTQVSEWAVDEVMAALSLSSPAAAGLLADAVTLAERLPATLDALADGRLSLGHARMLAEV